MKIFIPADVEFIINEFYKNGYKAFMVGGCVRDTLLGYSPRDYDITTSALPEYTLTLFNKTIPTGLKHGTVTVIINNESYEVTTFRADGDYKDGRHPEAVKFLTDIQEDLSRRDFTINSLAYNSSEGLIDYFNGLEDINNKVIRSVGDANKRFNEDALRMLRAIRFSCQLNFNIDNDTLEAIKSNYLLIKKVSSERIRDELCKILISDNPSKGLKLLKETKLLKIILPEIYQLIEFTPNCNNHNRDVFKHTLKVLDNTHNNLILRLSALFHDVGKLNTMTFLENGHCYFPYHSEESAKMTKVILSKLRFDNDTISRVCTIINEHLILHPSIMPSDKDIKKLITKVGENNINLLFDLQRADTKSLCTPELFLKKVDYINERVDLILKNNEPLKINDLAIDGNLLISEFNLKPGKIIGELLNYLLELVLDDSSLNNKTSLLNLSKLYLENSYF